MFQCAIWIPSAPVTGPRRTRAVPTGRRPSATETLDVALPLARTTPTTLLGRRPRRLVVCTMWTCAGTPRPSTRSTMCAWRAVAVTSTYGTAHGTCALRAGSRWSLLGMISRRPGGVTILDRPRLPLFLALGCGTRASRRVGAPESRSSGHVRVLRCGCGDVSPDVRVCWKPWPWLLGIPTTWPAAFNDHRSG